jgi:hypothetical protein
MIEPKITKLEYRWETRPGYVPLTTGELETALELAEYDVVKAAKILKIDLRRLNSALSFPQHAHLMRKVAEVFFSPLLTVTVEDDRTTILVKKPSYVSDCKVFQVPEDLLIEITRNDANLEALARKAGAIMEDRSD